MKTNVNTDAIDSANFIEAGTMFILDVPSNNLQQTDTTEVATQDVYLVWLKRKHWG